MVEQSRPSDPYVPGLAARLPWGGRQFLMLVERDSSMAVEVTGEQLIADTMDEAIRLGLVRGMEDDRELTDTQALDLARMLVETAGDRGRRYSDDVGWGIARVLENLTELETVAAWANAVAGNDATLRDACSVATRQLRRYLKKRGKGAL